MNLPKQIFNTSKLNKKIYGEVSTDFKVIQDMLNMIPIHHFKNPSLKWLDPACGKGYFPMILYNMLFFHLREIIPNDKERKHHILKNMIFMIELNSEHIKELKTYFGEKANIFNEDFLSFNKGKYDFIIGNPPYNSQGLKKVPTNTLLEKKKDGKTIWRDFIKHSVELLNNSGYLNMIVPSIWMKPDKEKMYDFFLSYHIHKIKSFSNTETNKMFHGNAQTPTCFFLLQKKPSIGSISLFDPLLSKYIQWDIEERKPLPLLGISILKKIQKYVKKAGHIRVIKTNLPSKKVVIKPKKGELTPFPNIKTCIFKKGHPSMVINYSSSPLKYHKIPKLIMAHKMKGCPFIDIKGIFGISNRDNYIIINRTYRELTILGKFLSSHLCQYLFEATRYRMKYLERYIFELLPDITKLSDFPMIMSDKNIHGYFGLTFKERRYLKLKRLKKNFY